MATVTKGITFGATEQVTNTKLNNLVDLAVITNIVDADCSASMNLSNSKLATIDTYGKVTGKAISNLGSLSSLAGQIKTFSLVTSLASGALIRHNGSGGWYASMT